MEKLVIYKNKGENFKCQFDVDGVMAKDVQVRLCLEFGDNKNLFFYGVISENGECNIQIPKLNELDNKIGKLFVEAIADSVYFKVYECEVNLKNSVEVKMKSNGKFLDQKESTIKETKIQLSDIKRTKEIKEETKEEIVEVSENVKNPFLIQKDSPKSKEPTSRFSNYLKNKRK